MTMRKTNHIFKALLPAFLLLIAGVFSGCTRNNGDVGPWFGMWQLLTVETDGVPDKDYQGNIFWNFQNDVFSMNWRSTGAAELTRIQVWGTWSERDNNLYLDFTHSEDRYPASGTGDGFNIYRPYEQTHLPYGEVSALKIVKMKGSDMVLTYEPDAGEVVYTYILKKR